MCWVQPESLGIIYPAFVNELAAGRASRGFESASEVVSGENCKLGFRTIEHRLRHFPRFWERTLCCLLPVIDGLDIGS